MAGRTYKKIIEILDSKDAEWIAALSTTIDALYQQFTRERQENSDTDGTLKTVKIVDGANHTQGARRKLSRAA